MMKRMRWLLIPLIFFGLGLAALPAPAEAALIDQVNQAFRQIHGRTPTFEEWSYWAGRVQRQEKTSYQALVGAIAYQKAEQGAALAPPTTPVSGTSVAAVASFKTDPRFYPSPHNPNLLPEGTLIKSPSSSNVFYVQRGKKSWVIPAVLDKWLNENHFFKHDIVHTISLEDFARYPQTASVNPIYIGKVLAHPNGTQFFIDDKLRKRQLSPAVRAGLKIPGGNLYPTSVVHLSEFKTGPALTSDKYPGGMVVYTGAYHGGRIWRFKEVAGGAITKHLYLSDYIYEADGNPDESHRAPAVSTIFNKHSRGANIERYPDGWTVNLGTNIFVVQGGTLRLITSPELFAALGYKLKYVLPHHPEFLQRYPRGHGISAFKSLTTQANTRATAQPQAEPNTAAHLLKVRPHIRDLINRMNLIYISEFDRDPTVSENRFWVDYLYHGEVNTEGDLREKMRRTRVTGAKPPRTSRTAILSENILENKWFPYLFYFVHQKEPAAEDRTYWFGRINSTDRNTIEKLGGTLQWLKDTSGATRK